MLDISRCRVPRMEFLFQLVEQLGKLRYNQLQLYTEHTFAYGGHEAVWRNASPMTAEEIHELDDHCQEHHIELVPNQNCFGHMERWLRHADYRHLAESPDGFLHPLLGPRPFGSTLYPCEESARFVQSILSELVPHFRSRKLNVGGDEPWELGQGRSKERVAEIGKAEVYREFLDRILRIARDLGSEPIFWADIVLEHPELVSQIPRGAVPAIWGYYADHPFPEQCRMVAEAGFRERFQVVPGTGSWNSWTGRLGDAAANIRAAANAGHTHGARGMVLTCWGDGGHQQPTPTMYPGLVIAARESWGCEDATADLAEAVDEVFYPDIEKGNGDALVEIGRIDGILPQDHPNHSLLFRAFFAPKERCQALMESLKPDQIAEVRAILDQVKNRRLDPRIRYGVTASEWALDRLEESQPEERLWPRLEELRKAFRHLWLLESREGGLEESLEAFPKPGNRGICSEKGNFSGEV